MRSKQEMKQSGQKQQKETKDLFFISDNLMCVYAFAEPLSIFLEWKQAAWFSMVWKAYHRFGTKQ